MLAAARIISGSGAFEVGGEGQQRNIHLGFISLADGFEKIQSHLLVVVMEALMKLSKAEYVKIIRELRAQGLAPTLDDHISAKKCGKIKVGMISLSAPSLATSWKQRSLATGARGTSSQCLLSLKTSSQM